MFITLVVLCIAACIALALVSLIGGGGGTSGEQLTRERMARRENRAAAPAPAPANDDSPSLRSPRDDDAPSLRSPRDDDAPSLRSPRDDDAPSLRSPQNVTPLPPAAPAGPAHAKRDDTAA